MGLVERGSISTRTSSLKRRMLQSFIQLIRLFAGLFGPEYQPHIKVLSSLAPQGKGASVKLVPRKGSILV